MDAGSSEWVGNLSSVGVAFKSDYMDAVQEKWPQVNCSFLIVASIH